MKPLWVGENNSNDTFECDDDANRVVLCTSSQFFLDEVGLTGTGVKKINFKDLPYDIMQKN